MKFLTFSPIFDILNKEDRMSHLQNEHKFMKDLTEM